jgi:hypothetical protein
MAELNAIICKPLSYGRWMYTKTPHTTPVKGYGCPGGMRFSKAAQMRLLARAACVQIA